MLDIAADGEGACVKELVTDIVSDTRSAVEEDVDSIEVVDGALDVTDDMLGEIFDTLYVAKFVIEAEYDAAGVISTLTDMLCKTLELAELVLEYD